MKDNRKLNTINRKVAFENSAGKKGKLYLHGDIGPSWFDSVSLSSVKSQLRNVKDIDEIEVHINSYGGDVFESIAILNYLKYERSEKITTVVDGIAASGGSIIFMAGDERVMPSNTQVMIHNPWTITYGNAKELRKIADDLEKTQSSLEECYLPYFVGTHEELKVLLDKEEFLTADESHAFGFATEILREVKTQEEPQDNFVNSLMNKYAANSQQPKPNEQEQPNIISNFINLYKSEED